MTDPASARRINAAAKLLTDPGEAHRVVNRLLDAELSNIGELVAQIQSERAVARGDLDEIVANGFEVGFARDGLAVLPWLEGNVVVCPGGLIWSSRTNHVCRFVSVNDCWVWDAPELIREDKRSIAGTRDGFRAVALIPATERTKLDVVSGKARAGQHSVDRVVSYVVRNGELEEVSQRVVTAAGMK